MPPVNAICLTILALLALASGALLTLAGAIGVAVGRTDAVGGMRVTFGAIGAVGLVVFIIGAACVARLLA
ncbi:hypothetical protein [Sphingomonas sp. 3-13AW]|uniref:hypothetical protein n=1 Tax=Sphingomonas sp. 3-13AW TaxID=3050450 RepID=UPI003BB7CF16